MRPSNLAVIALTAGEKWSGDTQSACKSASISSRLNSINHRGHCRARRVRRPSALAVAKVCNRAHNQGHVSSYSLRPKQGFDQQIVYVIWNLPAELLPKQHFHVACGQVTVLPKKFGKSRICFAHRSTPRRGGVYSLRVDISDSGTDFFPATSPHDRRVVGYPKTLPLVTHPGRHMSPPELPRHRRSTREPAPRRCWLTSPTAS